MKQFELGDGNIQAKPADQDAQLRLNELAVVGLSECGGELDPTSLDIDFGSTLSMFDA